MISISMNFDGLMVPIAFSGNEMVGTFLMSAHACKSSGEQEECV